MVLQPSAEGGRGPLPVRNGYFVCNYHVPETYTVATAPPSASRTKQANRTSEWSFLIPNPPPTAGTLNFLIY